ncbi:MAG: hypothetical protein ACI7YS_03410 [Flavobacterium sp.]
MKKLNLLLLFLSFVLLSCSKNELMNNDSINNDSKVPQEHVLVSKTIETDAYTSNIITSNYSYEGNKLISITRTGSNISKTLYTYTDDLITKVEDFDSNEQVLTTRTYSYNNGKLVKYTWHNTNNTYIYETDYTYISNETINYTKSRTEISTNSTGAMKTGTINMLNGNFMSDVSTHTPAYYEYDSKKQPFRNITGFNFLMFITTNKSGNQNNATTINFPATETTIATNKTYNYIYNSNDYPTEEKIYYSQNNQSGDLLSTIQYFYQ